MKAIKRTVAALLATLMLATSTSFTLAAENYSADEAVVVAKVNAAGIMQGTDKGFEPSKSLTRAEAAAIIVRMKGISESTVKTMAGTTLFKDVAAAHWASGYVNQASNLGIIKGISATEFAPDREVTVAEFVTMAVRALGAGQLVDSEGVWPTNYVNFANENGLLDDVAAIYTATASRLNAATIVANTLEAPMWEKTGVKSNGEITWSNVNGKTILANTLNISSENYKNVYVKAIDTKERTLDMYDNADYDDGTVDDKNAKLFGGVEVADTVDMASLKIGVCYDAWYNTKSKKLVGVFDAEDAKTKTVAFTEIVKVTGNTITFKVNGEDKKYDYDNTANMFYYNQATTAKTISTNATENLANGVLNPNGNANVFGSIVVEGDDVDFVYAESYEYFAVVKEAKSTKLSFESSVNSMNTRSSLTINKEDKEYVVTRDGKEINVSDIDEGDAIAWYEVGDKYVIDVMDSSVSGVVKAVSDDKYLSIDGKKYYVAATGKGLTDAASKDEVTVYLNKAGKIVMLDVEEGVSGEYAIIAAMRIVKETIDGDGDKLEIKYITLDGVTSDWTKVELKKSIENGAVDGVASYTKATAAADVKGALSLRDLVTYKLTSGKVELTNNKEEAGAYKNTTGYEDKILAVTAFKDASIDNVTATIVIDDSAAGDRLESLDRVFYLTDSTKIFDVTKTSGSNSDETVKLVELSADEIDTNAITGFVAGIDYDESEIKYLVISAGTKRVKETNFAFILDVVENYDYSENDDVDRMVDVLYADGSTKTYYIEEDVLASTFTNADMLGQVCELTLNGEYITDFDIVDDLEDELVVATETSLYLAKEYANGTREFSTYSTSTHALTTPVALTLKQAVDGSHALATAIVASTRYTIADDVMVISLDEDGEYAKSSFGKLADLEEVSYDAPATTSEEEANDKDAEDASEICKVYGYVNEDAELTIIAIVYNK